MALMTSPPSEPSGSLLLGSQRPRLRHVPDYAESSGYEAVELAARAGLELDPWEEAILVDACGVRRDGKWAAFEVGINVPRQNGKGSILEARELAGAILFGEKLLIHSAHEQATSSEHFRRLLQLIEEADFQRRLKKIVRGKGAEAIEFKDGTRILFKTRTGGGGRGLTGDFVGLDEAMIIPETATAALVPTLAAMSIHGNPQLWYAGSAVDQMKHEHGVVFARLRERGLKGTPRVAWFEFSVEGDSPDTVPSELLSDPKAWAEANPGLGIRISAEHIENEFSGALGPREFAVERLGIGDWPATTNIGQIINRDQWDELRDDHSAPANVVCFAFDVTPDRSAAAIAVAGTRADGRLHVEIVEHRRGTSWIGARLGELVEVHENVGVVCDALGPAGALLPALATLEVEPVMVSAREHAQACGMFYDKVQEGDVRHLGTTELTAAVLGASSRSLGEAWAWSRKSSAVDISPLVASTLALWGIQTIPTAYEGPLFMGVA